MAITIQVPWHSPYGYGHGKAWNELLAWTLETYGLNGDKWAYTPTENYMNFHFPDEQDALMFQLKTAGRRLTDEEVTVAFAGGLINR
jgi:hypothetical protein